MRGPILILTGAGISAESGLSTFRDPDGVWSRYDLNDVATPEGFARDPGRVHEFYNARRRNCRKAAPNAAHKALTRLERGYPGEVLIVTQNVDDLHERAGSVNVWHMHGRMDRALCAACGHRWDAPAEMSPKLSCPACAALACRPDVVWFGEMPYRMDAIPARLAAAELFVSIGTSGNVHPAAGFVEIAASNGARTLELNLEPSVGVSVFDHAEQGLASELAPRWVDRLLSGDEPASGAAAGR